MDDAELVRLLQRAADLDEQRRGARPRQRAVALDHVREVEPAHVLHDQVQRALRGAEVEDLDGVRVMQPRDRGGLALEPRDNIGVVREIAMQHLHRGDLAHAQMLDAVDDAHAAAADHLEHAIAILDDLTEPLLVRVRQPAIRDESTDRSCRSAPVRPSPCATPRARSPASCPRRTSDRSSTARRNRSDTAGTRSAVRVSTPCARSIPASLRIGERAASASSRRRRQDPGGRRVRGPGSRVVASLVPGVSATCAPVRCPVRAGDGSG